MATKQEKDSCGDRNCPKHGQIAVRGRVFVGQVVSDKMQHTVTVQWQRRHFIPKYQRYEKRRSKVAAHNSPCINAKTGDTVTIQETRPLSKTKTFVVTKIGGEE